MDALENVLLDGAGQRIVVAEEKSLGEIDHVEEAQAVIFEVLFLKSPRKGNVFLALEREEGFELVFGGGLDLERNDFGVLFGIRWLFRTVME